MTAPTIIALSSRKTLLVQPVSRTCTSTVYSTNAIYHMLILLGIGNPNFPRELQQEDFTRMAEEAKYIIGSAYDRESYIIWERTNENSSGA